jgi:hypothetical protein
MQLFKADCVDEIPVLIGRKLVGRKQTSSGNKCGCKLSVTCSVTFIRLDVGRRNVLIQNFNCFRGFLEILRSVCFLSGSVGRLTKEKV